MTGHSEGIITVHKELVKDDLVGSVDNLHVIALEEHPGIVNNDDRTAIDDGVKLNHCGPLSLLDNSVYPLDGDNTRVLLYNNDEFYIWLWINQALA